MVQVRDVYLCTMLAILAFFVVDYKFIRSSNDSSDNAICSNKCYISCRDNGNSVYRGIVSQIDQLSDKSFKFIDYRSGKVINTNNWSCMVTRRES